MSKMLAEIREQPAALQRTLKSAARRIKEFSRAVELQKPRLVVLAARGTSDNAALFGRYLIEMTTGLPVSLAAPSIQTLYGATVDYRNALVIGVSQSGESPDVNVVVAKARDGGALTLGITNEPQSALAQTAEHVLLVGAGKERSVAATKTYTGQMMVLYLVAKALGAALKTSDLEAIPGLAEAALELEGEVTELAGRFRFMNHAVVVGRGLNYANVFEMALKLMETCYVVAERFSSADFLHGPIAMVDPNFPVFAFGPAGPGWPGLEETLLRLRGMKTETVVITDKRNRQAAGQVIRIPVSVPEIYSPIPYIIPAQIFAAALAKEKGLDPDKPRSLNKVTRTL
jgi:glucosamine--fructose-6-phosphate aminotransferase (isomerizing)